jgi:ABC-type xylose transport system substrate-binding protein
MRKLLNLTVLSITVCFFSCSGPADELNVGVLIGRDTGADTLNERKLIEHELGDKGLSYAIGLMPPDGENTQLAKEMLGRGAKVLIISSYADFPGIAELAAQHGAKIVSYGKLARKAGIDYHVTYDYISMGRQQAQFAFNRKMRPEIAIIGGDITDSRALMLHAGQSAALEALSAEGGKLQECVFTTYNTDSYLLAYDMLEKTPEINSVLVFSDEQANAVSRAAADLGRKNLTIASTEASPGAMERISQGRQSMGVYMPFRNIAMAVAGLAHDILKADTASIASLRMALVFNGSVYVPSILLPSITVDSTNVSVILSHKNKKF